MCYDALGANFLQNLTMKHFLAFLLCLPIFLQAQTRYDLHEAAIATADSLRKTAAWQASLDQYNRAFNILTPKSVFHSFRAAECALQLGKEEEADKLIRMGFIKSGGTMEMLNNYKGFSAFKNGDIYQQILKDYNSLRQQYFAQIENIDIYLELEKMHNRDQFPRKVPHYLSGRSKEEIEAAQTGFFKAQAANDTAAMRQFKAIMYPKLDPEQNEIRLRVMLHIDTLNVDRLMEITEEYGWPNYSDTPWLILWHQRGTYGEDNYVWNYFKPVIDKEIEAGNVSRDFWTMFEDLRKRREAEEAQSH